jgi:predicted Zn-dependent peptidase
VRLPHLHSALVGLYVRAGSRHETAEQSGVGHFLEHMFFRGSRHHPDTRVMNAAIEDVGGSLNGYTSRDHALYYTPVHPDGVPVAMSVLADVIANPLLRELELEREIILEEMLDEVDDRGADIDLDNLTKATLWSGHPLALKIAGTPETVGRLTLAELRAHHERFYVGSNLVLCVAGPLEHGEVLERARAGYSAFPRGERSSEQPPPAPPVGPRLHLFPHDESQTEFRLNFLAPPEGHPDHLPLTLLRRVLDDGLSSRLPFRVVERKGLAYSLSCNLDAFDDVALFEVEGAASHAKVGATVAEVTRTLGEIAAEGPTAEELVRAVRRFHMAIDQSLDSTYEMAGWFGGTALHREPESLADRARAAEALTVEDLRRVVFRRDNLLVTAVGSPTERQARQLERAVQAAEGL